MRLEHVENWWDDFKTWILSYRLKANGFDANNQTVDNVAPAVEGHQAPNLDQVTSMVQTAQLAGELVGAIYNVSGTAKIFRDSNADGEPEELTSAIVGLYFVGDPAGSVLDTVTYPAGAVIRYTGSAWYLDSVAGTQSTFDPTSAYADPGGARSRIAYRFLTKSYAGHNIPLSDTDGWYAGQEIVWNAAYDSTGDDNIGRWVKDQTPAVAEGSQTVKGVWKILKGFKNLVGSLEANIDEENGLSWNGDKFRVNILDTVFGFVGGALKIIDGAITRAMLSAGLITELDGKVNNSDLAFKTGHLGRSRIYNGANLLQFFNLITGTAPAYSTTYGGLLCSSSVNGIFTVQIPVLSGKEYRLRVRARNTAGGAQMFWGTRKYDHSGAFMDDSYIFFSAQNTTSSYVDYVSSKVVFASGVRFIDLRFDIEAGVAIEEMVFEEVSGALHDHIASQIPDFQTTVSANTDVSANTAARHTHSNKALLDTYTQTEVNLEDAVSKKHAHGNQADLDQVQGVNTGDQDLSAYALTTNHYTKTASDARYTRTTRTRTDTVASYTSGDLTGTALSPAPVSGTKVFCDYQYGVTLIQDVHFTINGSNQPVLTAAALWFTIKNGDKINWRWEG